MADDLATLQTRLSEAKAARHDLVMGKRVSDVLRDGRRIRYSSSQQSLSDLTSYIGELENTIAAMTGEPTSDPRLNRRFGTPVFS